MSSITIGIDLGTTNSALAVFDPLTGQPQIVPNRDGERLTPSAVYRREDGDLIVGTIAVSQARRTPESVQRWVKREMGRDVRIKLGDEAYRPEELSAAILRSMVEDAQAYFDCDIAHTVVTVPAWFEDAARKATQEAATLAGLPDARIVNEPTAAGLTYGLQERPGVHFLVLDLGGGTFDVSVMRAEDTEVQVLAVAGDRLLGGYDFDTALAYRLAERFEHEHGFAPGIEDAQQSADWHELMQEAEEAKKKLSVLREVQATVRCRSERSDLTVTRAEFEDLLEPFLGRAEELSLQAIVDADVEPEDIGALVLVGGSTRIPAVRARVKGLLPHLDPLPGVNPDEVVAQGASVRAHLLSGAPAGRLSAFHEVTAHPYGILVKDGNTGELVNEVLIPRNTPIPHAVQSTYYTIDPGQTLVEARVTQGDGRDPGAVDVVASTELELPDGRPPDQAIDVEYRYDDEGRMHCRFHDRASGEEASLAYARKAAGPETPELPTTE